MTRAATLKWDVRPHGELVQIDDGIFTVTGTIRMPVGPLPRRMNVVRLTDGRLVIYSAIALDESQMEVLERHGRPAFLVVPNGHHRLDAKAWKQRYPQIQVVAPPGVRERVAKRVAVDTTHPRFRDAGVHCVIVRGTRERELALQIRRPGGTTLVLNDVIANIRESSGVTGWFLRRMGFAGHTPRVPTPVRLAIVTQKAALRAQLLQWATLPNLKRILVSHGDPIEVDPAGVLRRLATTLE